MNLSVVMPLIAVSAVAVVWLVLRAARVAFGDRTRRFTNEIEQSLADAYVFVSRQKVAALTLTAMIALPVLAIMLSGNGFIALAVLPLALALPRRALAWM